jgi:hypothetical protein
MITNPLTSQILGGKKIKIKIMMGIEEIFLSIIIIISSVE